MLTEMKIKITVSLLDDMMNYVIPYEKDLLFEFVVNSNDSLKTKITNAEINKHKLQLKYTDYTTIRKTAKK